MPRRFDVSVITTSRLIYEAALEAFFEVNTIRFRSLIDFAAVLCIPNPTDRHSLIRSIEIYGIYQDTKWRGVRLIPMVLRECLACPRLQKLTIGYDRSPRNTVSLRSSFDIFGLEGVLTCVDIGLYELRRSRGPKVYFKHIKFMSVWSQRKFFKKDLRTALLELNENVVALSQIGRVPAGQSLLTRAAVKEILSNGLESWIVLYEFTRVALPSGGFDPAAERLFRQDIIKTTEDVPLFSEHLPSDLQIKDIDRNVHSPELLEWASELLAFNM